MASEDSKHELGRPRYKLESHTTSTRNDNASFTVRRNGKAFYIEVSPLQFVDSPATTEKYLSYLEVLRLGEEVIGDIYETRLGYPTVRAAFRGSRAQPGTGELQGHSRRVFLP